MHPNRKNITFDNLSYSVRVGLFSRKSKRLLSNIYGDFRSGELTAIMGPSGAGKSTLMDILSGYTIPNVTGIIKVNGQSRNLLHSSTYIMQSNDLHSLLTVQETMNFAADLKFDSKNSSLNKSETVNSILKDLGLDVIRDTLAKNLSGGQKKRLAIAIELISNPPIMFFDEPTSGLDSVSSRQCFELLRSLSRQGRTIICTLHQPSATILEMIDHLYVLGNGQCVYTGCPKNLVNYLANLNIYCPTYHNPADYLLEIVSGEYGNHIAELVAASKNGRREVSYKAKFDKLAIEEKPNSLHTTNSLTQIAALIKCNLIKLSRNKVLTNLRLSVSFFIALTTGILFYGIGQDAAYSFNNFNLIFFTLLYLMFLSMNTTLVTFPLELPMLRREYFNHWYKLHSYYLANRLADLPIQLLATLIYLVVIYCMSGQLIELDRMSMFLLTCMLISLVAQMNGLIIGASFGIHTAAILGPISVVPTMIFSGFFVHLNDAHPSLQWLFHLSFCKYGFEGVMYATYGLARPRLKCSADYCHFSSPKVILKEFGAEDLDYWFSVSFLAGLYVILNIVAYAALKIKLKMMKNR